MEKKIGVYVCECGPNTKKLRLYDRFIRDITDLLRVKPDHEQGRYDWMIRNVEASIRMNGNFFSGCRRSNMIAGHVVSFHLTAQ